jgi:hypothetical protein
VPKDVPCSERGNGMKQEQKISLGEMRSSGVRATRLSLMPPVVDQWPDDVRLSDLKPSPASACCRKGADVRPGGRSRHMPARRAGAAVLGAITRPFSYARAVDSFVFKSKMVKLTLRLAKPKVRGEREEQRSCSIVRRPTLAPTRGDRKAFVFENGNREAKA